MAFMRDYLYVSDVIKKEIVDIENEMEECRRSLDALSGNSYYKLKNIKLTYSTYSVHNGEILIDDTLTAEMTNLIESQLKKHIEAYEFRKKRMEGLIYGLLGKDDGSV